MIRPLLCLLLMAGTPSADFFDSINPDAQIIQNTDYTPGFNGVGWDYTPTQDYVLTGISSRFEPIGQFGTGSRTMTVQIQTDRPADGGTVLGQGTFTGDSVTGGTLGADFAPVLLTAGTTYFVDFLNVGGMGLNLGQWGADGGVHIAAAGATTRLPDFITATGTDFSFAGIRTGNAADQTLATGNASGLEPILFFSGHAVPEPSSLILLAIGAVGVAVYRRRS